MYLTAEKMKQALSCFNDKLARRNFAPVRLIMGGGGAMLLAHQFQLATADIDALPAAGTSLEDLDPIIKEVGQILGLPHDWLNPYFSTFTHVLPQDYSSRLIQIMRLSHLSVDALSKEDLLIMKCFAARRKDFTHARALVKKGADLKLVENHLGILFKKNIPGTQKAIDFLDEVVDIS